MVCVAHPLGGAAPAARSAIHAATSGAARPYTSKYEVFAYTRRSTGVPEEHAAAAYAVAASVGKSTSELLCASRTGTSSVSVGSASLCKRLDHVGSSTGLRANTL